MKKCTKGIIRMLVFTMVLIGFTTPFTYADSPSQWAKEEVHYLFEKGIVEGPGSLSIDPTGVQQAIALTKKSYKLYDRTIRQVDTLIVAQGADARLLDPHGTNDLPSSRVMGQIYETIVKQNENMEIEPGLAESWKHINEHTIEFKLKKGVKFHNGEELTSEDVKFTFLRGIQSPNVGHILGQIDPNGIEIIDEYTIRISTIELYTPILANLAHEGASILNKKAVISAGDGYGNNPIGTGPFKFETWQRGESIELSKFNDYHGEAAKLNRVVFKNVIGSENRFSQLESGKIHVAYDVGLANIEDFDLNKEIILHRKDNLSTSYVGFNTQKKPFDDVRVRQAINYAIDVEVIVEEVMGDAWEVTNGPLGSNVWASNQDLEAYGYDVEQAKELMKEAGYEYGFSTTIWTNDNKQRMDIAKIVQNQLQQINIDVEVKVVEWGTYLDATANGYHDMFILGWTTVTGDADYGLYPMFHSSHFGSAGNRNFYSNKKVDELLDKARVETDLEKRKSYYLEAQKIIRDDSPWIFLNTGENLTGTRSGVKGFNQHPTGIIDLSKIYLEKDI